MGRGGEVLIHNGEQVFVSFQTAQNDSNNSGNDRNNSGNHGNLCGKLTESFLCLQETYTLEHTCGGVSASHPSDRMLNLLTNFVLPLCIRVGCGCRGEIISPGEVFNMGVGYMIEQFIYMELTK